MRYEHLSQHPTVFQKCTGLTVPLFDQLVSEVLPLYLEAEERRRSHSNRQRAIGAGHPFELAVRDPLLLTVVWLRLYPIHEVLAYLFGISDSTVSRLIERVLPILEQSGQDGMRLPDPGKKRRRQLPELTVIVDSFEQRVQRPPHDDSHYSGKKKHMHRSGINTFFHHKPEMPYENRLFANARMTVVSSHPPDACAHRLNAIVCDCFCCSCHTLGEHFDTQVRLQWRLTSRPWRVPRFHSLPIVTHKRSPSQEGAQIIPFQIIKTLENVIVRRESSGR